MCAADCVRAKHPRTPFSPREKVPAGRMRARRRGLAKVDSGCCCSAAFRTRRIHSWLGNPRRDTMRDVLKHFVAQRRPGRTAGLLAVALLMTRLGGAQESLVNEQRVPTRQSILPAGRSLAYPARPVDLAVSGDGQWVVVKDDQGLAIIDAVRWQIAQRLAFPEGGGSMHGVLLDDATGRLWATTAQSTLYEAQRDGQGRWRWRRAIALPGPAADEASHACGMALDSGQRRLYVCLSRNNSLGIVDLAAGRLQRQIPVGVAPYDVLLMPGGQRAVVSNWGGRRPAAGERQLPSSGTPVLVDDRGVAASGTVSEVDLVRFRPTRETATGLHPADLIWDARRNQVLVANANSDTVTVLDGTDLSPQATLIVRPDADLPFGTRATRWR